MKWLRKPTLQSGRYCIINGLFNETAGSSCFLPARPRSAQLHCSFCWATLRTPPTHTHTLHAHNAHLVAHSHKDQTWIKALVAPYEQSSPGWPLTSEVL